MEEVSIEDLRERFKLYDIRLNPKKFDLQYPPGLLRKACILIPLFYRDGDYRVILTVRSNDLTHHAGHVVFPGGMQDDDDEDEIHTALREAEEEIGLDPKFVEIICICSPTIVRPNTLVYPVIARVKPDFKLKINAKEVSMAFDLPLSRFLSKEQREILDVKWEPGTVYHAYHFIDNINGTEVDTWGSTAGFCIYTAIVLYQSEEKFNLIDNEFISKDNVFNPDKTREIIARLLKIKPKF